jgi:predicted transcriptional regulator
VTAQKIASLLGCALETVKSHLKAVKARYETHGDPVRTRTDMLKVGLRDHHVEPDWYRDRQPGR